jgi:hypothetical protein
LVCRNSALELHKHWARSNRGGPALDARFAAGAAWMKGQIIPIADAMMSVND